MMEKKYRSINHKIRVYLCKNFIFFNMSSGNSLTNDIYIYLQFKALTNLLFHQEREKS